VFGSLGGAELIVILVVALLLFGPRKLPGIGKTLGSALAEFRRATTDFKMSLEREVNVDEIRDIRRDVKETVDEVNQLRVSRDPAAKRMAPSPAPTPPPAEAETAPETAPETETVATAEPTEPDDDDPGARSRDAAP